MHNGDDTSTVKLAELLKHPDDLHKIGALKSEFTRKKAAVDAQLKLGLAEQLQLTQAGLSTLHDGQSTVAAIKQEMMKIDRLGTEAQAMIKNFPEINAVAQAHRNFVAVETMQGNIDRFQYELGQVQELLKRDEQEIDRQPYLLNIHHAISRLRNIKEDAMEQISRADDPSLEDALNKAFEGLDDAVDEFDEHVGLICVNLLRLLEDGGDGLIVKLAIVIEEEEKFDTRTKELQEAQREFKGIAANFKTLAAGPRELRGYKDKMLGCIRQHFEDRLALTKERFQDNPDGLIKSLAWYFNELNAAKIGMVPLMPKKWKIFRVYTQIYHEGLRKWLEEVAKDPKTAPTHMLAIIHAKEKYMQKMNRLGAKDEDLQPPIPGGHDGDLVQEYQQLIATKLNEWMTELNKKDGNAFLNLDMSSIERSVELEGVKDEQKIPFRTNSLGDMWRIFREQLIVASAANITQVTERVCDAIFSAIETRRQMWIELIKNQLAYYETLSDKEIDHGRLSDLHEWLITLANDQIAIIDDEDGSATGQVGFLRAFSLQLSPLVGPQYRISADHRVATLQDQLTDLSIHCMRTVAHLIIVVDSNIVFKELFTPAWSHRNVNTQKSFSNVCATFSDYLHSYKPPLLREVLRDCLIIESAKAILQAYLRAVHNRQAKFRTADDYLRILRQDYDMLIDTFESEKLKYNDRDYTLPQVYQLLSVFDHILILLHARNEEEELIRAFDEIQQIYWDVKIGWVEALLRCRDDMDSRFGEGRKTLNALRKHAVKTLPKGRRGPNGEIPTLMELVDRDDTLPS